MTKIRSNSTNVDQDRVIGDVPIRRRALRLPAHELMPLDGIAQNGEARAEAEKISELARLVRCKPEDDDIAFHAKIINMRQRYVDMAPEGPIDAALALQFLGIHEAILESIERANAVGVHQNVRNSELAMLQRLAKSSVMLADGMARLRGKSEKTITIEYRGSPRLSARKKETGPLRGDRKLK